MNFLRRRYRRWKYAHRCTACGRRYMWTHAKCPTFANLVNAQHNLRVDAEILQGHPDILPHGMKVERKLTKDPCCDTCTGQEKEFLNGQSQK
jgi:hypothetical protein